MPEPWEQISLADEERPLPERFFTVAFADNSYDRISPETADKIKAAVTTGEPWYEYTNIAGGRCFAVLQYVVGIVESTDEIRKKDRHHTRYLRAQSKEDTYLKSLNDDD